MNIALIIAVLFSMLALGQEERKVGV